MENGGSLTLTNSTLEYSDQYGVWIENVETQAILNNTIQNCDSYGIYYYENDSDTDPASPEIRGNVINNTSYPIYISSSDGFSGEYRITDNTGSDNTHNYIYINSQLTGNVKLGTSNGFDWVFYNIVVKAGTIWELGPDEVIKITSGSINVYGSLVVNTTADHPVIFTHLDDNQYGYASGDGAPEPGDWYGIEIKEGGSAVLDRTIIRYGGNAAGTVDALVHAEEGTSLTLTNSTLEYSDKYGVWVDGIETPTILNNTIQNCASYGTYIYDYNNNSIPVSPEIRGNVISNTNLPIYIVSNDGFSEENRITDNTGSDNTHNYIYIISNLTGNVKLGTSNSFDWVFREIKVNAGAVWELGPDEVIKISGSSIRVFGSLITNTTADHPVVFTDLDDNEYGYASGDGAPEPGDWYGIEIKEGGSAVLDNTIIRYGGNAAGTVDALVHAEEGASLTLTNSTLEHSEKYGVWVENVESPTILNNTIQNCASYGIYVYDHNDNSTPASPEIRGNVINNTSYPIYIYNFTDGFSGENRITDNTGSDNTYNYIYIYSQLAGNVKLGASNDFDWVFPSITVSADAVWELGPDEVIKISGSSIRVFGSLITNTTADHPVVFTDLDDNEYGYASGDGAPEPGDWYGIEIKEGGSAVLDRTIIRYGGNAAGTVDALVHAEEGASLTLTNSTLEHSEKYGVWVENVESPTILNNTIQNCASYGIYVYDHNDNSTPASPEIRGNVINNTSYPIYIYNFTDGFSGENRITDNTGSDNTYNYIYIYSQLAGNVKLGASNDFDWVFPSITVSADAVGAGRR